LTRYPDISSALGTRFPAFRVDALAVIRLPDIVIR
jgi:hypothetical protein